jgi:mannose-6-phosphate isomerase-like protein (cupin superfamily)
MSDAVDALRSTLADVISSALGRLENHAELFASVGPHLMSAEGPTTVEGVSRPVVDRWLDIAVENAATGPHDLRDLAECFQAAAPGLAWKRAYDALESTPELEAYRAHYAWVPIAVPVSLGYASPYAVDDMLVGFTIQAPNVVYPHHHHEAPELYGVISGAIDWEVGTSARATKTAGDVIVHRSFESHSMITLDQPGLTWAAWPSHAHSKVYMPSMDPPGMSTEPRVYD